MHANTGGFFNASYPFFVTYLMVQFLYKDIIEAIVKVNLHAMRFWAMQYGENVTVLSPKKFPKLYQVIRIDNIQGYKNDKKLYISRLKKLIDTSEQNVMYGEWNYEMKKSGW